MKININGSIVEVSNEDLTAAIEGKKETIEVKDENLVIRSKDAQETYEKNVKAEAQTVGEEIGRKSVFKELEIDIEGTGAHKDPSKSAKAIQDWNKSAIVAAIKEAKIDPDKKVETLTKDLEILRGNLDAAKSETEAARNEFSTFKKSSEIRKDLVNSFKDKKLTLPVDDVVDLMLIRNKFDKDENGNTVQIGADGNPMKDNDRNLLSVDSISTSFLDKNPKFISGADGGAGGGDSGAGGSKQTYAAFTEEMAKNNIHLNSEPYIAEMEKREAAGLLE